MAFANLILQWVTVPFVLLLVLVLLVSTGILRVPKGFNAFAGWLFVFSALLMALAGGIYLSNFFVGA